MPPEAPRRRRRAGGGSDRDRTPDGSDPHDAASRRRRADGRARPPLRPARLAGRRAPRDRPGAAAARAGTRTARTRASTPTSTGTTCRTGWSDATTDERLIRRWFARWPNANVGIRTGRRRRASSSLDVDPRHGGDTTLRLLQSAHGRLPDTPEAVTGGGGRHLLFAHPGGGVVIRSAAGRLGDGPDVRADGGYIVAPPSRHASGRRYAWELSGLPGRGAAGAAAPPGWRADSAAAPANGAEPRRGRRPAAAPSRRGSATRRCSPWPAGCAATAPRTRPSSPRSGR